MLWVLLNRTRFGLRLRSAGENPEAARTLGFHPTVRFDGPVDSPLRKLPHRVWHQLAAVQQRRFAAAGCDIIAVLNRVEDGIAERGLSAEVIGRLRSRRPAARRAARR